MSNSGCYICPRSDFIDDHHIDCQGGKLSPETVPLCRRCHKTYHIWGVSWFDNEYLDKAIEIENRRREILNSHPQCVNPFPLLTKADIKRSDYFNKTHGLPRTKTKEVLVPFPLPSPFPFHLPCGEPLCGWQWVNEHLYDLVGWVPRIEIIHPDLQLAADIDSKKKLRDVIKAIRGLKGGGSRNAKTKASAS